jgi:DNA repair protein RadC
MITKDNLHAGHRERMMRKVLSNVDSLEEHELLEVLLFTFIPRIDTNPIAHELIRFFGSLEKVFSATAKDLTSVNGVGEKTACYITVIGAIYKKLLLNQKPEKKSAWKNFEATKNYLIDYYDGIKTEEFLFILLDSKFKEISKMKFEDKNKYTVTADIPEIAKALVVHKPSYALIAHNHPSGNINLSEIDDITTMKINMICELHGVSLIDHVVVAGKNAYSYFTDGKLQHIKEISSVNKILKKVNGKGE